jgi:dTDP-4-dehydrorhamnose 3,5-epimerase
MGEQDLLSVYIPQGVAHGFYAESDVVLTYLQSRPFGPTEEFGVLWNDARVGIDWPCDAPLLSDRDRDNPLLKDFPAGVILPFSS